MKDQANSIGKQETLHRVYLHLELVRVGLKIKQAVQCWVEAGQDPDDKFRGLSISEGQVQSILSLPFFDTWGKKSKISKPDLQKNIQDIDEIQAELKRIREEAQQAGLILRLDQLRDKLGLGEFEYYAFLLCLLVSVDPRYEKVYGFLQDDVTRKYAGVGLLLDLLTEPDLERLHHLRAFQPEAPLLRFGILKEVSESQMEKTPLSRSFLVSEEIIAWLIGEYQAPEQLNGAAKLFAKQELPQVEPRLMDFECEWDEIAENQALLAFYGSDAQIQIMAAVWAARKLGMPFLRIDLSGLPAEDFLKGLHLALRDALLNDALLCLNGWESLIEEGLLESTAYDLLNSHPSSIVLCGSTAWRTASSSLQPRKPIFWQEFSLPDGAQRLLLWKKYLPELGNDLLPQMQSIADQFILSSEQIINAAASARSAAFQNRRSLRVDDLYQAARMYSSHQLDSLAVKIKPRYDWNDIVLPEDEMDILREMVNTVRGQTLVLDTWGLKKKLVSSSGLSALFAGPPGTGKTLAAQVIAAELGMDLYKIDLSTVVSKYIGETEKNLERIFGQAKNSNAILFFDEADAIFGKRSEVKDAHDRYANIEVGYLLQRMESYDGVVILATNLRANLDDAFTRRLQFVIDFPFPDEVQRQRIWNVLFPPQVPREESIRFESFARQFKLAGGSIRNVIVTAAFQAASNGEVVTEEHLLHGVKREMQKMGRLIAESDLELED